MFGLKKASAATWVAVSLCTMLAPHAAADPTNGGRVFGGSSQVAQKVLDVPGSKLPETSRELDLEKYSGTWYQVAAVPQPFTLQCARDVKAQYSLLNSKTVGVKNTCVTYSGGKSEIEGSAKVKSGKSLRVNFPGVPFQDENGKTNYRVTYLADDYSLAVVGDPNRLSGFVLSRSPELTPQEWKKVKNVIAWRGWNPCTFLTVPMTGGRSDVTPLCRG